MKFTMQDYVEQTLPACQALLSSSAQMEPLIALYKKKEAGNALAGGFRLQFQRLCLRTALDDKVDGNTSGIDDSIHLSLLYTGYQAGRPYRRHYAKRVVHQRDRGS